MNYEDRVAIKVAIDRRVRERLRHEPRLSVPVLKRTLKGTLDGLVDIGDGRMRCAVCQRESSKFSSWKHEVDCVYRSTD
jgi:hypothetical protein